MTRFTLTIPNEPPRQFKTRRDALAYIRERQRAVSVPATATLVDSRTGTIMTVPAGYYATETR